MLSRGSFNSILFMSKYIVLLSFNNTIPQICISFVPHKFHMIYYIEESNMLYEISYMTEMDANEHHLLYSATNSIICEAMSTYYNLTMKIKIGLLPQPKQ